MKLLGKTVLITGAAKRVGHDVALHLSAHGAFLLIHYNKSAAEARALQKEIEQRGGRAAIIQANFSQKPLLPVLRQFVAKAYKMTGQIDVLINNASAFYPTEFGKVTETQWEDLFASNLKAPFFLSQEIGTRMVKHGSGKILNMVDWFGFRPDKNFIPYSCAKAGLIAATRGLAKVLAPRIQVAGIAPGPILPPPGMSKEGMKKAADKTLLKRFGSTQDIAETIRFFIEGSDFITGHIFSVDGGALIR